MSYGLTKMQIMAAAALALVGLSMVAAILLLPRNRAEANPQGFTCPAFGPLGTASTSVRSIGPGTGTTTLVYDSFCANGSNQPTSGNAFLPVNLALLVQETASSSASVLNMDVEYSQDNVDWYQDNYLASTTGAAGWTGSSFPVALPNRISWTFASSTVGGSPNPGVAAGTRLGKVFKLSTPTRYLRVIFTAQTASSTLWGEILPETDIR